MTVRGKVEEQSPDGNVLLLEDLRRCLGMGASTNDTIPSPEVDKGPLKVILMGHDMRGDFLNMKTAGIDISQHLHYAGCGDTHIWIEDTGRPLPKGLSGLIDHYGLAQCHYTKPLRNGQKWVFIGAHNAGNDAVMTIKLALAQALDQGLISRGGTAFNVEDCEWINKPLQGMDAGMILLAYDTESTTNANYKTMVLNRTTEHGFAWLRFADVIGIAPDPNGVNWYPYIQARHWINRDLKTYKNRVYCVGNPHGFWDQYGKSLYYTDTEGPAPFQALFKELAEARRVGEAAAEVERLALEPLAFPSLSDVIPTAQREVSGQVLLPEKRIKDNTYIIRPDVNNKWNRGNPWANGPPNGVSQSVQRGSSQRDGRASTTRHSNPENGLVDVASTISNGNASIGSNTAAPIKAKTSAGGNETTKPSTTAPAKITSSWAQIARGR